MKGGRLRLGYHISIELQSLLHISYLPLITLSHYKRSGLPALISCINLPFLKLLFKVKERSRRLEVIHRSVCEEPISGMRCHGKFSTNYAR